MKIDVAYDLMERLPDAWQARARDLTERPPAPRRRRRGLVAVGVIAGLAAAVAVGVIFVKRVFAPGYAEEPLGEPHTYPTTGSGTGWPEPPLSPDHTETLGHGAVGGSGDSPSPPAPPAATVSVRPEAVPADANADRDPADDAPTLSFRAAESFARIVSEEEPAPPEAAHLAGESGANGRPHSD